MSKSAFSTKVFAVYLLILGPVLILSPKFQVRHTLGTVVFIAAMGGVHSASAGNGSDDVHRIGRDVRASIRNQFKAETQAHGAMRILDMTDSCRKLPLVGKTVDEANTILKAAGQSFDLLPNHDPGAKLNELVGGMVLENDDLAYSAVFNIRLHATQRKGGTIDSVVYCNVLTRSL